MGIGSWCPRILCTTWLEAEDRSIGRGQRTNVKIGGGGWGGIRTQSPSLVQKPELRYN